MKKSRLILPIAMLAIVSLMFLPAFLVGCKSLGNGELDIDPFALGRATAVGYLLSEPALSPEKREAIRVAWVIFRDAGDLIDGQGDNALTAMKSLVDGEVSDPVDKVAALVAVDYFWNRLAPFVLGKYAQTDIHGFLSDFRNGVKSVVEAQPAE